MLQSTIINGGAAMRYSSDILSANSTVENGYDYSLQVWVENGVVQRCGHPTSMHNCCNAAKYAGQRIDSIPGHDVR
jgi:hypothetical protein